MRIIQLSICSLMSLLLLACSSLTLEHVRYGWPVEEVATVDNANRISSDRHGLSLSVAKIAENEMQDSTALTGKKIRIIRNDEGYYFITAPNFKHVYVFSPAENAMAKESIIEVSQTGLRNPALNLRSPYIELIDTDGYRKLLTHSDIAEGNSR